MKRTALCYTILILLLGALLLCGTCWGSTEVGPAAVMRILLGRSSDEAALRIVRDIRLPRVLATALLGGALAVSGFLLQTFLLTLSPGCLCWGYPPARS